MVVVAGQFLRGAADVVQAVGFVGVVMRGVVPADVGGDLVVGAEGGGGGAEAGRGCEDVEVGAEPVGAVLVVVVVPFCGVDGAGVVCAVVWVWGGGGVEGEAGGVGRGLGGGCQGVGGCEGEEEREEVGG